MVNDNHSLCPEGLGWWAMLELGLFLQDAYVQED
jgi:hypothetical protein